MVLAGSEADFQQRGHVFMVADGMGGHAAGELASKIATDVISLDYRKLLDQTPPEALLSAVLDANHQIHVRGQASPEFRGMGTTATILVLLPTGALLAHVGDSRCYRVRGNRIEQLTFDHSYVWEMQAAGQLPEGGIPGFISKSSITRSLGPHPTEQVDLEGPHPVQAGDTFLLCSDGLSNQVKDEEIGLVLSCLPPAEAVHALIELACLRGGPDNITAVVVRVLGPQVPAADRRRSVEAVGQIERSARRSKAVDAVGRGLAGDAGTGGLGAVVALPGGFPGRRGGADRLCWSSDTAATASPRPTTATSAAARTSRAIARPRRSTSRCLPTSFGSFGKRPPRKNGRWITAPWTSISPRPPRPPRRAT